MSEPMVRIDETLAEFLMDFIKEHWEMFEEFCKYQDENPDDVYEELNNAHS